MSDHDRMQGFWAITGVDRVSGADIVKIHDTEINALRDAVAHGLSDVGFYAWGSNLETDFPLRRSGEAK
jgi:hypothetical protein